MPPWSSGRPRPYAGAVTDDRPTPQQPADGPVEQQPLSPLPIDTARIVLAGTAAWLVALVLTLLVPTLHSGARYWWPWACVTGLVLGLLGLAYLRRGRGNAAGR